MKKLKVANKNRDKCANKVEKERNKGNRREECFLTKRAESVSFSLASCLLEKKAC